MRVTDKVLQNNLIANINFTTERLYESETRVLTNKRLNRPSDDPVDTISALNLRSKLNEITQYQRNINRSKTLLANTESYVDDLVDIFQRAGELAVQGASDSYSDIDKLSIAYEVDQLLEQSISISNSRSEDIYIFAGTNNDSPPYQAIRDGNGEVESIMGSETGGDVNFAIGENITIKVNVNGKDIFENNANLFEVLVKLRDDLRSGQGGNVSETIITIDEIKNTIYNVQSIVGSRVNRIEAADTRAEIDKVNFSEFLSNVEDIDASLAIQEYQTNLVTLQAALQVGSQLFRPKLMDFL